MLLQKLKNFISWKIKSQKIPRKNPSEKVLWNWVLLWLWLVEEYFEWEEYPVNKVRRIRLLLVYNIKETKMQSKN